MKKLFIFWTVVLVFFCTSISATLPQLDRFELSMKKAIFLALKNNLNLKIQMTGPQLSDEALTIQKGIFIPNLEVNLNTNKNNSPSTDIFSKDVLTRETLGMTLTLSQRLALGGTLSVRLDNSKSENNQITSTLNPSLSSTLSFSLTQPLLKGLGTLATKIQIYSAATEFEKSKHDLKLQIIDLINQVENAYWNLVYAHQSLDANKKALERANDLLRQNEIKVKVGSAAQIDILQAKADVARNESLVIQAEQTLQNSEENLKRILNMTQDNTVVNPVEKPVIQKLETDFNSYLLEAWENRPEMEKARLDLKNNNLQVRYFRNQMLPTLELTAQYYTTARGGDQLIWDGNPLFGDAKLIDTITKDIYETMKEVFGNIYKNYSVGLRLQVPLSLSSEKADLARAKLNLKRALLTLKNTENTIYSELKNIIKELESRFKLVEANTIAVQLYEQRLEAEKKKLSVGLSTNFDVITAQNDYLNAQTSDLRSRIDYNLTIAQINKILAKSLEVYDIQFKEFIGE